MSNYKEGWERALTVSFFADPLEKVLGKATITREELQCTDQIVHQLVQYGFLRPATMIPSTAGMSSSLKDWFEVVISGEEFYAAKAAAKTQKPTKKAKKYLADIALTETDEAEFKAIVAKQDAVAYFSSFIAPKIREMDHVKQAILIALASGWDEADDRFRVHVLMYGKESSGTAKTPLLKWLRRLGGAYIDSTFATRAGIAVNLRDGSPGVLAQYHQGVCACDELDKMPTSDRDGFLAALEDGVVIYASGNGEGEYPAEIIGIAGANSISRFTPEQLLRFDFRFEIHPYTEKQACNIADAISKGMGKMPKELPQAFLAKFLKWTRLRKADVPDDVRESGAVEIKGYIRQSKNTDIRRVESIWRVARAIARLNYRDVTLLDVKTAIRLLNDADKTKEIGKELER
jgi:DNA replicative helicase MCM subunit Mcm2 (Cdc46/Mcm family)